MPIHSLLLASLATPLLRRPPQAQKTVVVILLGPPGAGKGTQAGMLATTLSVPHISTGDLLRDHISKGSELGSKAKTYMNQGQLVPDALILDMLFERVAEKDCAKGYILDGFPRTLAQAEAYSGRLRDEIRVISLNLLLKSDKILERLEKRVICKECSTPYHLISSPPKKRGVCDMCRGALIQREDDRQEVIENRLKVYEKQTAPLIDYYREKKILRELDCNRPIRKVLQEIVDYVRQVYRGEIFTPGTDGESV